tara:strand:+ start:695 stop:961 length:267 start_codon:yes stop_codon:yes gene_type:complete
VHGEDDDDEEENDEEDEEDEEDKGEQDDDDDDVDALPRRNFPRRGRERVLPGSSSCSSRSSAVVVPAATSGAPSWLLVGAHVSVVYDR